MGLTVQWVVGSRWLVVHSQRGVILARRRGADGRHHQGVGQNSGGLSAQSFDRDYAGVPADLPGLLRLRQRSSRRRRQAARAAGFQGTAARRRDVRAAREAQAAARVDRRRRAAGALPRARRDSAAHGRHGHLHAGRDERGAADSDRVGRPPPPADRRVDRRTAARTRRAPQAGDLRAHPEAHRGAQHHACTAR